MLFVSFIFAFCIVLYVIKHYSVIVSMQGIESKHYASRILNNFDIEDTKIARIFQQKNIDDDKVAALFVGNGTESLLHRTALTTIAQKSILLQTYIYKNDPESRLLMFELWRAANRGVSIRILIDDNGLDSDFSDIITLDSHPNIDVRIFNPYRNRLKILRLLEMIIDFRRITHRMHNKLFIVDNLAMIVGGRNIADNYFDMNKNVNFVDTDVIFVGKIAQKAVENFTLYWNYHRSIPATLIPTRLSMKNYLKRIRILGEKLSKEPKDWEKYNSIIDNFLKDYSNGKFRIFYGKAEFIADLPEKIDRKTNERPLTNALEMITQITQNKLLIAAAYFVPGKRGILLINDLLSRGIKLQVLTNSLSSVDSVAVYAKWEYYRDIMLKNNIEIYEYPYHGKRKKSGILGKLKSDSSLHSKVLVFDEKITWIGSFNLDQRSKNLNTEVVVVFDNADFAKHVSNNIYDDIKSSWKLVLENDSTTWQGYDKNGIFRIYKYSPDTSIFLKVLNIFAKILPENQI